MYTFTCTYVYLQNSKSKATVNNRSTRKQFVKLTNMYVHNFVHGHIYTSTHIFPHLYSHALSLTIACLNYWRLLGGFGISVGKKSSATPCACQQPPPTPPLLCQRRVAVPKTLLHSDPACTHAHVRSMIPDPPPQNASLLSHFWKCYCTASCRDFEFCNTRNILQHAATCCSKLHHIATHCSALHRTQGHPFPCASVCAGVCIYNKNNINQFTCTCIYIYSYLHTY